MSAEPKGKTGRTGPRKRQKPRDQTDSSEFPLHHRPGFLIRRLHQIHVALFFDECAQFDVTPVQYSVLSALREHGCLDQASLAKAVGLDRTNVAEVVRRLAVRGLIIRSFNESDQRMRMARLSDSGWQLVRSMDDAARHAHERTVAPLSPTQRKAFIEALQKLVGANNDIGRAPLRYTTGKKTLSGEQVR